MWHSRFVTPTQPNFIRIISQPATPILSGFMAGNRIRSSQPLPRPPKISYVLHKRNKNSGWVKCVALQVRNADSAKFYSHYLTTSYTYSVGIHGRKQNSKHSTTP